MKDKEMNLEDVKTPHTLGWVSYILFLHVDSTDEVVNFFEVDLEKLRNLKTHESEECEDGKGVFVYDIRCCLL